MYCSLLSMKISSSIRGMCNQSYRHSYFEDFLNDTQTQPCFTIYSTPPHTRAAYKILIYWKIKLDIGWALEYARGNVRSFLVLPTKARFVKLS